MTAARSDSMNRRGEQVAAQVARAYLARAVKADADVETAQANVTLSEALLKQAENQKTAGTGTGIEITRARCSWPTTGSACWWRRTRARSAVCNCCAPWTCGSIPNSISPISSQYMPVDAVTLEQAQGAGAGGRGRIYRRSASAKTTRGFPPAPPRWSGCPRSRRSATTAPSAPASTTALPTRTVGISVRVPIFDGGRRDARRAESASQYRAEKVRTNDLKEQIELDVRLALDALQSAEEQVKVAKEGLELSPKTRLTQARRRYDAGVASGAGSDRRADAPGARAR